MAQPTTPVHAPAQPQTDTPGVGKQGNPPKAAEAKQADPVLFDDIDPVLLVRLYPDAKNAEQMRAEAMKAGEAVKELGAKLVASQQEPMPEFDEHGQPKPAKPQPGQPGAGVPKPGPGGTQPVHPQPPPPIPPAPPPAAQHR